MYWIGNWKAKHKLECQHTFYYYKVLKNKEVRLVAKCIDSERRKKIHQEKNVVSNFSLFVWLFGLVMKFTRFIILHRFETHSFNHALAECKICIYLLNCFNIFFFLKKHLQLKTVFVSKILNYIRLCSSSTCVGRFSKNEMMKKKSIKSKFQRSLCWLSEE